MTAQGYGGRRGRQESRPDRLTRTRCPTFVHGGHRGLAPHGPSSPRDQSSRVVVPRTGGFFHQFSRRFGHNIHKPVTPAPHRGRVLFSLKGLNMRTHRAFDRYNTPTSVRISLLLAIVTALFLG